jgi:GT2 family glycosyltransferase
LNSVPDLEKTPDISLVIINMNAADMLGRCLRSVLETQGSLKLEVIIVDNGSQDGSLDVAEREYPGVVLIPHERNIGYVKANNVGLARATGRNVLLLNNDTVLLPECLQHLSEFLDLNRDTGAVSAQILNPDGTDQGVARRFPSFMNAVCGRRSLLTRWFPGNRWSRHYMVGLENNGDSPFQAEFLSTACLMMRTEEAKAIGGMDEEFTHYWCDAELCQRVIAFGLKVYCVPKAKILHFEGQGGSNKTWKKRLRSTVVFHRDAYLAYVKVKKLPLWHPMALLAAGLLSVRAGCLISVQFVRPSRAMTSGNASSRAIAPEHPPRSRLPETMWSAAADMAQRHSNDRGRA